MADGLLEAGDEAEVGDLEASVSAPSVPSVEAGVGGDWKVREAEVAEAQKQQLELEEALRATKGLNAHSTGG